MKKFNAKKIRVVGAALAIGVATFISAQAFADDFPSTDSTIVLPSVSGTTPSTLDVEEANEVADNDSDVQLVGSCDEDASDVSEDAKDDASDVLEDAKDDASDVSEASDDDDEASDDDDEASDDDCDDVEEVDESDEEDD